MERDRQYLASLESLDNGKPFQVSLLSLTCCCILNTQDAYNIDLALTIKCYR